MRAAWPSTPAASARSTGPAGADSWRALIAAAPATGLRHIAASQPPTRRRDRAPSSAPTARPSAKRVHGRGHRDSERRTQRQCGALQETVRGQSSRAARAADVVPAGRARAALAGDQPGHGKRPERGGGNGQRPEPGSAGRGPGVRQQVQARDHQQRAGRRTQPRLMPSGAAHSQPRSQDGRHGHEKGTGDDEPGRQVAAGEGDDLSLRGDGSPSSVSTGRACPPDDQDAASWPVRPGLRGRWSRPGRCQRASWRITSAMPRPHSASGPTGRYALPLEV